MYEYPYLRKSLYTEPLNYSYSIYGGDNFLNNYYLARTEAIDRISSNILTNIQKQFSKIKFEKQVEFIVYDNLFNGSIYTLLLNIKLNEILNRGQKYFLENGINRLMVLFLRCLKRLEKDGSRLYSEENILTITIKNESGFLTDEILILILLSYQEKSLVEVQDKDEVVRQLSKKYEVFQRIFTSYNTSFRKTSDKFSTLSNYGLLGLILLQRFESSREFQDINTALKINDLLAGIDSSGLELDTMMVTLLSIKKELSIIQSLSKDHETAK